MVGWPTDRALQQMGDARLGVCQRRDPRPSGWVARPTLVVGKKLDEMESQLEAIEACGFRPTVTGAPVSELPAWRRGLEQAKRVGEAEVDPDEV
jgi:hypothetical protein